MAIHGLRVNVFNENFLNESEQDANSVLTELDKGLRSAKLGVQCEALVRFPRLFEKYPFPILISSSFLKLAEFFLNGSNLLRFWVFRVCQQSENHLDKILNIDAFVKRIYMVIYSNDPIARALTLRTLGAVSRVISEKQQVHHAIRRALDSHDSIEVEAAIYASGQFAAQSRSFAISMCAKISDMIESLLIPVPMKLLLIPILRHMHHDTNTAVLVKNLCISLMPKYPAQTFVVAILDTLTYLSARTLCGVTDQINLLLGFLIDARKSVRGQVLSSLRFLTQEECAHAWSKSAICTLIEKANACVLPTEQYHFLIIIRKLTNSPLICKLILREQHQEIRELCLDCISSDNYGLASQALAILTGILCYMDKQHEEYDKIMNIVNMQMEGLLFCCIGEPTSLRDLQIILSSAIRIAIIDESFAIELLTIITDLLSDDVEYPISNALVMCKSLGKLGEHFQLQKFAIREEAGIKEQDSDAMETDETPIFHTTTKKQNPVFDRLSVIFEKLNSILNSKEHNDKLQIIEILTAVCLQTSLGTFIPKIGVDFFDRLLSVTNCWTLYRIARSCSRYGQHYLAAHLFSFISGNTIVDKIHFFFIGLTQIQQAECILKYGVNYEYMKANYDKYEDYVRTENPSDIKILSTMERLESAINLYWQGTTSLRASSSSMHPLQFQLEYIKLRAQMLQTLHNAVTVKHAQVIVPPPAIASSLAQNSRDQLQKHGYVTNQLRKLVKLVKNCQESFSKLYKCAFDADPLTLEFLEISEYQCALFAHLIETICFVTPTDPPAFLPKGQSPETRNLVANCRKMEMLISKLPTDNSNTKTISNGHLEIVMDAIELIISSPHCLPRYFFQTHQSTQIKLSVSPQPRTSGEPVIVQSGSNLVIKVEGVIQHFGKKRSIFRTVDSVQLTLNSQLLTQRPTTETNKPLLADYVTLTQTVKPHRDFLTCSFLLPLSSGGQWQVTLETFVIDEHGFTWSTGPKNSMLVRMLDDTAKASTSSSVQAGQTRRF